jgi:diaminobutyrate-2-oxoglutarate transaminase
MTDADPRHTIERLESEVRSYCRTWPAVFDNAGGSTLVDNTGRTYLDFFAGAGALNYGHNHPHLKEALIDYVAGDHVVHSLDQFTVAKAEFLERFEEVILRPRGLDYKVQFPGPAGTNAVEAALKLARKVTGRNNVISFTNAFHGMTLGSLSVTGNSMKRKGAGVALTDTHSMPYDGFFDEDEIDSVTYLNAYLEAEAGSGLDIPAAVIVESVQAEGGINVASFGWLKRLEQVCREHDVLLIVDDIQAGCGRTGPFLSYEPAGISPDIVCLSKSLSGYGLPFAITLLRPELDQWEPGEHNATFRGHNPAFVTAKAALDFWTDDSLTREVERKGDATRKALADLAADHPEIQAEVRGRGLINGLACNVEGLAPAVCEAAFERGLLMETSGPESDVVKLLPPLVISDDLLSQGLEILGDAIEAVLPRIDSREPASLTV